MSTDTELRVKGLRALSDEVDAERFVTLLLREPFDYTKWRRDLWADKTVGEISKAAMRHRRAPRRRREPR